MNPLHLADWTTKQTIAELVEAGAAKAAREQQPVLISFTERISPQSATDFFADALLRGDEGFLWVHPDQKFALAGVGVAHRIETHGTNRFRDTAAAWQTILDSAIIDGVDTLAGSGPTLLGGFSFDPLRSRTSLWEGFADGSFIVPRHQLLINGNAALLTENLLVEGNVPAPHTSRTALPSPAFLGAEAWQTLVAQTTDKIRQGQYEKVVLARGIQLTATHPFDVYAILNALQAAYPWAYTFAITRNGKTFLGATPERLVSVASGIVRATGLAGTAKRGVTPDDDELIGAELLASDKNRHEHAVVVEMLRNALSDTCLDVHAADAPQLLKLANVQHLYTPVSGRLRPHATLMDLIARLHPTPAVGGLPSPDAVAYIRDNEQLDRGWYAAPIGWLDARKEGDFAVALRSGLIEGNTATLFAGCGIVGDSEPGAELAETELKLQPMRKALAHASL
jgi:isochorismate synthase